jgi:hypothetical protein
MPDTSPYKIAFRFATSRKKSDDFMDIPILLKSYIKSLVQTYTTSERLVHASCDFFVESIVTDSEYVNCAFDIIIYS